MSSVIGVLESNLIVKDESVYHPLNVYPSFVGSSTDDNFELYSTV